MQTNDSKTADTKDSKEVALHYMQTLVDVARESFLILDKDLNVLSANPIFYDTFKVTKAETEDIKIYQLGNGQWDIPSLRSLLEQVLLEKKDVKNYEVTHDFESIGAKTILLNAGQIDSVQLIILAMEDVTERKMLEQQIASQVKELEKEVEVRTVALTMRVAELEALNKSMVGRELKIVELKNEIKKLEAQLMKN